MCKIYDMLRRLCSSNFVSVTVWESFNILGNMLIYIPSQSEMRRLIPLMSICFFVARVCNQLAQHSLAQKQLSWLCLPASIMLSINKFYLVYVICINRNVKMPWSVFFSKSCQFMLRPQLELFLVGHSVSFLWLPANFTVTTKH